MTNQEIIKDLTSKEVEGIRKSGWHIIKNSQNEELIKPLIPYYGEIESSTKNLKLGGGFAANARFGEYATLVIEHYKNDFGCSCNLFPKIGLDLDPNDESNNVKIIDTIRIENKWVDYYIVECGKCNTHYKVFERNGHWTFYEWTKIEN